MKTNRLKAVDRLEGKWLDAVIESQDPLRRFIHTLLDVPGTPKERSKPQEAPRRQSGRLSDGMDVRLSFGKGTLTVTSDSPYWKFLDAGSGTMEARPIREPIRQFGRNLLLQEFRNQNRGRK